jgi:flagellar M-ring protein FliF
MARDSNQVPATTAAAAVADDAAAVVRGPLAPLRQLGGQRLAALGGIAFVLLGFFTYLVFRIAEPQYALLYAGLELEDSAQIVGRLEAQNVPYRLRDDGASILVPAEVALRLRIGLAEDGLPRGGSVGYEIFDQLGPFDTSSFLADVNLRRALEGELGRTIAAIAAVRAARVHLVMPKRELFRREQIEPSASVTLRMSGTRRLTQRQVLAIQHLVAAAVPGLGPERITIVDDDGTLLARGGEVDPESLGAGETEDHRAAYESRLRQTIETLLERSLGPGRVRAQVNAEMNFDRVTTTEEVYDPDGQVVRSTQSVEEESDVAERDQDDAVSVGNNLPNTTAEGLAGRTSNETTSRSEETVNYEISRTVRNHTQTGGRVRRLSVAVLVDGRMVPDESGALVYTELAPAELEQLEALVRSAVGFDQARGDVLEVINMPFNLPVAAPLEVPWLDIDKRDLVRLIELAVLAMIAVVMLLLVVRPTLRHLLPAPAAPALTAAGGATALLVGEAGALPALTGPSGGGGERIDLDQVDGQVSADLLRRAVDAIENTPLTWSVCCAPGCARAEGGP